MKRREPWPTVDLAFVPSPGIISSKSSVNSPSTSTCCGGQPCKSFRLGFSLAVLGVVVRLLGDCMRCLLAPGRLPVTALQSPIDITACVADWGRHRSGGKLAVASWRNRSVRRVLTPMATIRAHFFFLLPLDVLQCALGLAILLGVWTASSGIRSFAQDLPGGPPSYLQDRPAPLAPPSFERSKSEAVIGGRPGSMRPRVPITTRPQGPAHVAPMPQSPLRPEAVAPAFPLPILAGCYSRPTMRDPRTD